MAEDTALQWSILVDASEVTSAAQDLRSLNDASGEAASAVEALSASTTSGSSALVDLSGAADAAGTALGEGEADLSTAAALAAEGLIGSAGNALADAITGVLIDGDSFEAAASTLAARLSSTAIETLTDSLVDSLVDGLTGSLGSSGSSSWTSWLGDLFAFADGGVMTASGPMPLRRYASGGIADEPQLALFGEGAHAEAYVPLPDGRSIPVTMQGAATAAPSLAIQMNVSAQDAASFRRSEGQIGATMAAKLQRYMQRYG